MAPFVILRLLPLVGGEPRYRVRSVADGHERAVLERQIRLMEERPPVVVVPIVRQRPKRR